MVEQAAQTCRSDVLLEVQGLRTHFFTDEGVVEAVTGVDFTVPRGGTLCVVGESGCGKSMTARSILQIVEPPGRIVGGSILFRPRPGEETDLVQLAASGPQMRSIRGREIGMIFQEPMSALSPVHTIGDQIMEAVRLHFGVGKKEARERAIDILGRVGMPSPQTRFDAYTFQLSGGMRQRACIAMALVCEPKLLIADEPTTALDVTTQANILDLIQELQSEMGMSVMFITHDLGVVAEIADEVAVMYLGAVVERARVDAVFHQPQHPYTRGLLESIPRIGATGRRLDSIEGMVPHPFDRPEGCAYHPRCQVKIGELCERMVPPSYEVGPGHVAKCLLHAPDRGQPGADAQVMA